MPVGRHVSEISEVEAITNGTKTVDRNAVCVAWCDPVAFTAMSYSEAPRDPAGCELAQGLGYGHRLSTRRTSTPRRKSYSDIRHLQVTEQCAWQKLRQRQSRRVL